MELGDKQCKDCLYFRQHYSLDGRRLIQVHCGHCTHRTPKGRRPDTAACAHFVQGTDRRAPFVSKEYLTKELLHYVLQLELLPEIE